MSRQDVADNSLKKLMISIIVVVSFVSLMVFLIVSLIRTEPNLHGAILEGFARQFQQSATNAHWQWQAKGRPERIMLLHFNEQGQEIDRRPVRMTHFGVPWAEPSKEGCAKLWQTLLNVPARIDGFRILPDYYAPKDDAPQGALGFCRYRLSRGPYFDYALDTGNVEFDLND